MSIAVGYNRLNVFEASHEWGYQEADWGIKILLFITDPFKLREFFLQR